MTTAKPKLMAGQTDSADDLIAELARLMAEDAQDKPKSETAPVRIPGGDTPVALTPRKEPEADASARPVRIPGAAQTSAPEIFAFDRPTRQTPSESKPESAPARVEPAIFAAFSAPKSIQTPVEPTAFAPALETRVEPQSEVPAEPVAVAPQEVEAPAELPRTEAPKMPALDQDSLASLIAAELAVAEKVEEAEKFVETEPVDAVDVTEEVAGQDLPRDVDVFGIPPVFGLAPKPTAVPEVHPEPTVPVEPQVRLANSDSDIFVPPPPHRAAPLPDPLEEIERLIGPAARVHQAPAAPSPALRSLATPVVPKREPEAAQVATPAQSAQVSSIEEAILAAAATSGAKVEWVEPAISAKLPPEDFDQPTRAPRNRVMGMTRSLAGPLVATLLLAVAAVGLYTVLGLGSGGSTGPAPLLVADTAPTKEVPVEAPDAAESSQSVVFNEISGANTAADEQIVSRDQSDVDAVTEVASSDFNQEGLVNRKVRTVTVRPDGTIVSGSDSLAGSAMLPVDRPTVPDVPGADFSTPDLIANVDPSATAAQPATQQPSPEATAATPAVTPVTPGATVPAVDLAGNPISGKTATIPLQRPANLGPQATATTSPASATPAVDTAANTAPTAPLPIVPASTPQQPAIDTQQTAAVSAPSGDTAPAYVQLSSQRSEEAARQTAQQIVNRYGPLFGGASLEVQRVDLGERGIFYRVRVPADSMQSAMNICTNVKAAGGDCFTL